MQMDLNKNKLNFLENNNKNSENLAYTRLFSVLKLDIHRQKLSEVRHSQTKIV